jgi:hypothetical protein
VADYGEWNRKDATLSDATAQKEYGVPRDFIIEGIRAGKIECREASIWGNPTFKILRSQLELYIAAELGADHLARGKAKAELRAVSREISATWKKLAKLEARKTELERTTKT